MILDSIWAKLRCLITLKYMGVLDSPLRHPLDRIPGMLREIRHVLSDPSETNPANTNQRSSFRCWMSGKQEPIVLTGLGKRL
jgi:hypothetical protein